MTDTNRTTWTIDGSHAEIGFAVRHLMISTVRGRFGAVSGTVEFDETHPSKSKVDVTVDVRSIDTRQEQRDNHLRSPDFFDVEKYPTMHFAGKRVEGDVTGEFRVVGDLTIRGITQEITLDVTSEGRTRDPWGNDRAGFSAKGKLSRGAFGLTWNQMLEAGGVAVGDEVRLSIDAELVKQAAQQTSAAA
ncbi:MAG: YceI family protein [Gemmatimonadaceae bacterium]